MWEGCLGTDGYPVIIVLLHRDSQFMPSDAIELGDTAIKIKNERMWKTLYF